jgi:hypothetical protein
MSYSTKEFMSSVKSQKFGAFSNWRDNGKSIGWIHPDGFEKRKIHNFMPSSAKGRDGETVSFLKKFVCSGNRCPVCALVAWSIEKLEGQKADFDDVIIEKYMKGRDKSGREKGVSYSLRDLAGQGPWQRRIGPTEETLFGWIPKDDRNPESPVEIVNATIGLSREIKRAIESKMEDFGDVKGDPLQNPYAIKLAFDKNEMPSKMYSATVVDDRVVPLTDEIRAIMDISLKEHGIDLQRQSKPASIEEVVESIEENWASQEFDFDEFYQFYRDATKGIKDEEEEDERPRRRRDEDDRSRRSREEKSDRGARRFRDEEKDESDVPHEWDDRSKRRPRDEEEEDERPRRKREEAVEPSRRRPRDEEDDSPRRSKKEEEEPPRKRRDEEPPRRPKREEEPKEEKPKSGRKKKDDDRKVHCPECEEMVTPSRYGKCPECAAELDQID